MSRRLRILLLNQYLPPDAAATAHRLADLAEDLARDHEVYVVAGRPSYNPGREAFHADGVRVVRAPSTAFPRTTMWGRSLNYFSFLAGALVRVLMLPRPDIVVAMTDPPVIGAVGALAARRHRCRFVAVYMDLYPDIAIALGRADYRALVWLWHRLNGYVRRTADRIVVVGRDMHARLLTQGVPAGKIVVRPNWAHDPLVDPETAASMRVAMGWNDRYIVLFAGNVGLAQGLDAMIDAAAHLRDRSEIAFIIVGDGAAKAHLERKVRSLGLSNVAFLPYRPHDEAQALVAAADLHVIPLAKGLLGTATPGKVYEIMAAGKPFVAAVEHSSEIAHLVDDHRCGVRVDPDDGEAMAEAILDVRARDTGEMGRRGRDAFRARYSRAVATTEYQALLESIAVK